MVIDAYVRVGSSFRGNGKMVEEYCEEMNRQGIDMAVLVPNKNVEYECTKGNEYVAAAVAQEPERFLGAVRIDPWRWNMDKGLYENCTSKEGMNFLFLSPWEECFRCNHPVTWPIYEFAAEHRIPVILEAGHPIVSHITSVYQIAGAFPDTTFILTNGGQHDLSGCTEMDVSVTLKARKNIYIGTATTINAEWMVEMEEKVAPGRVLFQSSYPEYDTHLELYRVTHGYWGEDTKKAVLGGNLLKLMDSLK